MMSRQNENVLNYQSRKVLKSGYKIPYIGGFIYGREGHNHNEPWGGKTSEGCSVVDRQ